MKYAAFLIYNCGGINDTSYAFTTMVKFHALNKSELEQKLEKLKKRKAKSNEGYQCTRKWPIEILVIDSDLSLVSKWKRNP